MTLLTCLPPAAGIRWAVLIGLLAALVVSLAACSDDSPIPANTSTPTVTVIPTDTITPVPTSTPTPMSAPTATPTLAPAPDLFEDAVLVVYLWVDEIVVNDRETSAFFGSAKAAFDVPERELQIIVAAGSRSVTFSNCISMWKDEPLTLDCSSGSGIFEQPLSAIASVRANTPEGGMRCERHRTSTIEEAVYACTPTTATPTATATPTDAPTPTPTPIEQLSPADLYQQVSPSIAFIETPSQTGSAVLTSGSYLITNYHVVWPYDYVRVVFPDGTDIEGVPVVGWDPMADLAVLGPVDVSTKPLLLQDAERDTVIGSELFLIGYLAETELIPKPSTTRGVLSRVREWERLGMTYFQTDAAIGSGQSGGALVNSRGHVVGISTFSFGSFALAASSADVMPIVEQIIKGEFTSGLGDRRLPVGQAEGFDIALRNSWDTRAFLLDATAGTMLEVEIEGSGDGWFSVSEAFGSIFGGVVLGVNDTRTGIEYGAVELSSSGVHILLVGQDGMSSEKYADFVLHSNVSLRLLNDPDDGRTVAVGATVAGSLDYPGDRDLYFISLNEGQTVRIYADSVNVDTAIFVDLPDSSDYQGVSDDDSGGGLFGTDAEIVYRAPRSGEYAITLSDAWEKGLGGYYLTVEPERDDTETMVPPAATPAPVSSRLETVRDRGRVICASRNDMPGFGYLDASGNNMGFDIDLCRAVAAAVLGDPSAIDIHLITASERGPTIQSGEVDMLVRTTTQTSSRDATWGDFANIMFYDGQSFMVRKESGLSTAFELRDATVCVVLGTTMELNLYDFSRKNGLNITSLTLEHTDAALAAYEAGQCDAITNDRSTLAILRTTFLDGDDAHIIFPETISEEPLGPVVPHGDDQWFDIVTTVMAILVHAEAFGIASDGVPDTLTGDYNIDRLLGFEGSFGQEVLGLSQGVAQDVIRSVGNYGEIYDRYFGHSGVGLVRENSRNALWDSAPCTDCPKGGQIYAPPLR